MWVSSVLLLSLLTTFSEATIQRYCSLFEGPSWSGATSNLTITAGSKDISLLVAHIADIRDPYLAGLDLDVIQTLPSSLEVRTMHDGAGGQREGVCLAERIYFFQLDKMLHKQSKFVITEETLRVGERLSHGCEAEGVYCAFAYEEFGDGLKDVTFASEHWSRAHSLTQLQPLKHFVALVATYWLHQKVFPMLSKRCYSFYRRQSFKSVLWMSAWGKLCVLNGLWLSSGRYETAGYTSSFVLLLNYWTIADHLASILVISVIYRVISLGFTQHGEKSVHYQTGRMIFIIWPLTYMLLVSQVIMCIFSVPPWPQVFYQDLVSGIAAFQLSDVVVLYQLYAPPFKFDNAVEYYGEDPVDSAEVVKAILGFSLVFTPVLISVWAWLAYSTPENYINGDLQLGFFQDMRVAHVHVRLLDKWLRFIN